MNDYEQYRIPYIDNNTTHAFKWRNIMRLLSLVFSLIFITDLATHADPITVPNTFNNGTVADASAVNNNFSALVSESNVNDARITAIEDIRTPISSVPFIISESGSYYLTGNLTDATDGKGITIIANNVELDLFGFTITGTGSSYYGIDVSSSSNISITNGTIREFGKAGIYSWGIGIRVIDIKVIDNGILGTTSLYSGMTISGKDIYIERSLATGNGGHGIATGTNYNATIINNIARNNGGNGIYAGKNTLVANNTVISSAQWGIYIAGSNAVVRNNIVTSNNTSNTVSQGGIRVYQNDIISDNLVNDNKQNNIYVYSGVNYIERNIVGNGNSATGDGIYFITNSNYYANNRVRHNETNYAGLVPTGIYDGGGNVSIP